MKYIVLIILLSWSKIQAQVIKAELVANGLTCSMCSFATQRQLQTLPFIDSIGTDLNHTTFILFFKKDSFVNIQAIRKKVEDAGFYIGSLIMYYEFKNFNISENAELIYHKTLFHIISHDAKTIDGVQKVKVIDKGYVSDKEYKKLKKMIEKHPCSIQNKLPNGVEFVNHLQLINL